MTKLVFCVLFRPSANENKQSSRPTTAQLDQHSSPSKCAKSAAEQAAVVGTQHLCAVECSCVSEYLGVLFFFFTVISAVFQ